MVGLLVTTVRVPGSNLTTSCDTWNCYHGCNKLTIPDRLQREPVWAFLNLAICLGFYIYMRVSCVLHDLLVDCWSKLITTIITLLLLNINIYIQHFPYVFLFYKKHVLHLQSIFTCLMLCSTQMIIHMLLNNIEKQGYPERCHNYCFNYLLKLLL